MKDSRRKFLKNGLLTSAGLGMMGSLTQDIQAAEYIKADSGLLRTFDVPRLNFAVIGMNHGHIYSMTEAILRGGGHLKYYFAKEEELNTSFGKSYPNAKKARSEAEILDDPSIQLVLSAGIPVDRAPLGIRVMKSGKDYVSDKPGITSLSQFEEVKKVQKETNQIYSIVYSERLENRATIKASELVRQGAIGRVIQTIGLGPHRMRPKARPDWFFDMEKVGGILTDIGSHQFDQFLHFTDSSEGKILASQVANFNNSQYEGFEDFGDAMVQGNRGSGYIRIDWFTPEGLNSWGDGRLTILGTEGFIEIRKNIDISGREGGSHLFLVDQKKTSYIDCSEVILPFGPLLVDDVLNRTETAMTQKHCFLATELTLIAQKQAIRI